MGEYIKKSEIYSRYFDGGCGVVRMHVSDIDVIPAADVAPVVHGRWKKSEKFYGYACCSICNNAYISHDWLIGGKWGYCPNCGAKMDMEQE